MTGTRCLHTMHSSQGHPSQNLLGTPLFSAVLQVVEGMQVDDAIAVMREAHVTGVAMVRACPQDEAEQCCEQLRLSGLSSSIEPGC